MRIPVTIAENKGIAHQTSLIRRCDISGLAHAVAVIKKYLITWSEWDFETRDGSLTLQRKTDSRMVIKVFVDVDGILSTKPRISGCLQGKDYVMVGVELTHLDPYIRDAMRDRLAEDFGTQYCDPRPGTNKNKDKVWLKPISDHFYDILVLRDGDGCPHVTDLEIDEIIEMIARSESKTSD